MKNGSNSNGPDEITYLIERVRANSVALPWIELIPVLLALIQLLRDLLEQRAAQSEKEV